MLLYQGNVRVHSLPELRPPIPPSGPLQKRLQLPQGELAQFQDGTVPVRYLAWIELLPGTVRGNHWHAVKAEYVYLIRGAVELVVSDRVQAAASVIPLKAGDLAFIPTGIAHALRVTEAGHAVEYSEAPFDPADIYPYRLV